MKHYCKMFIICLLAIPTIAISGAQDWMSSFVKYEQTMSIPVPNGYLLKSAPSLESHDVTVKHIDDYLLVVGHVDVDGERFYMTEWSWSQYHKGKNPNWVLLLSETSNQDILNTADTVLAAFENQDGQVLADLAHPIKGVRFSPNTFIEISTDPVFSRAKLAHIWSDFKTYYWGEEASADDERHPINMRPSHYFYHFIAKSKFRYEAKVVVNETFSDGAYDTGTAENIMAKVYPHTEHVDYYIKPDDNMREYLRLVFERMNGKLFLVGVIHSSAWTP